MQAALQGPDTQQVARPTGAPASQRETIMSKLARILAIGVLFTAMSLGSAAHAQTSDSPSQPAGPTQPGPATDPGSGTITDPGPTTATTTTTTTPTTPSAPIEFSVAGSSRQGQLGTTVALVADLGGCPQPIYASGVFHDHAGGTHQLTGLTVTGARLTARYTVGAHDAVGWGHFTITCWRDTPAGATSAGVGNWSIQVLPRPPGVLAVTASPPAGRLGTVVTVTANVRGGCDPASAFFQDHKGLGVPAAAKHATIVTRSDRQLVARYTVSNKDPVGPHMFMVACGSGTAGYRVGSASFQVRSQQSPTPKSGPNPTSGGQVNYNNDGTVQLPSEIDTGQGGTADRGLDPVWLLLPAGLLLIAVALGFRLRQTTGRRRP